MNRKKVRAKKSSTGGAKKPAKNRKSVDGGFVALSGFYFQFLATFADYVKRVVHVEHKNDDAGSLSSTLLGVEVGDQDVVQIQQGASDRSSSQTARVIQIKFSNQEEVIAPQEANEILTKMHDFAKSHFPSSQGWQVEFVLLTNRPESDAIKRIKAGRPGAFGATYPLLAGYLDSCLWDLKTVDECWATIEKLGSAFGMNGNRKDGEIWNGVARVWLRFLDEVTSKHAWFSKSQVEAVFAGYLKPYKLNSEEPRECVRANVHKFCVSVDVPVPKTRGFAAMRPSLVEALRRAVNSHSLVVVRGKGGNGKTTLMALLLEEWAETALVTGQKARHVRDDWVSQSVSLWRNVPEDLRPSDKVEESLKRVPSDLTARPAVVFGLDGRDEADVYALSVNDLVYRFRHLPRFEPPATLIVTCRDLDDLDLDEQRHPNEVEFAVVEVDQFSFAEMQEILRTPELSFGDELRQRLKEAYSDLELREQSTLAGSFGPLLGALSSTSGRGIFGSSVLLSAATRDEKGGSEERDQLLRSLRHPVVWGSFCSPSFNDQARHSMLNDASAQSQLADEVARWFARKCRERRPGQDKEEEMDAMEVLKAVAGACPSSEQDYAHKEWIAASEAVGVPKRPAQRVLRQAVASGLVDTRVDPLRSTPWRWSHAFLPRYLSNID